MRAPVPVAASLFALLAACAPTADGAGGSDAPPRARQCFSISQVSSFRSGRSDQVFLRVGRDDIYELSAAGGCPDLDFANQLALIPDGGTVGTRLCTGDWARVVLPGSTSHASACRVRIGRQLTAEEVAALPANHRP